MKHEPARFHEGMQVSQDRGLIEYVLARAVVGGEGKGPVVAVSLPQVPIQVHHHAVIGLVYVDRHIIGKTETTIVERGLVAPLLPGHPEQRVQAIEIDAAAPG